jgi:pyroglutamyl-peptidase
MALRVLLTGFRRFGPHTANPSEELVERLRAHPPRGVRLVARVLPVEYRTAFSAVREVLDAGDADVVLHLGLAAARPDVQVERFALNWRGGEQPDEAGVATEGEPVDPSGPAAFLSTVPVDGLVAAIRGAGLPCTPSSHAGTFLCNQVLYQTLLHADRHGGGVRAAFLHLPTPGPEGGRPDIDALVRGVEAALRFVSGLPRPGGGAARTRPGRKRAPSTSAARRRSRRRAGSAGRRR